MSEEPQSVEQARQDAINWWRHTDQTFSQGRQHRANLNILISMVRAEVDDTIKSYREDLAKAEQGILEARAMRDHYHAALTRIATGADAPDIDVTGDWQRGLYCGVEDRDCQDRYQGADYGHAVGVEKGLEWARNEARAALETRHESRHHDAITPSGKPHSSDCDFAADLRRIAASTGNPVAVAFAGELLATAPVSAALENKS